MAEFDAKTVHKNDWGVMIPGVVILLASFLAWVTVKAKGETTLGISRSASRSVWSGDTDNNFIGLLACLLCIAAAVWVALRVFGKKQPDLPTGPALTALILSGAGLVLLLLWMLLFKGESAGSELLGFTVKKSRGLGSFLALLAAIAQTAFAFLAFKESGEKMAFDSARMPKRAAGTDAPPPPPASGGYAAPVAPVPPVFAPPPVVDAPVVEAAAEHDHDHDGHDHDDHEGHDHPHA